MKINHVFLHRAKIYLIFDFPHFPVVLRSRFVCTPPMIYFFSAWSNFLCVYRSKGGEPEKALNKSMNLNNTQIKIHIVEAAAQWELENSVGEENGKSCANIFPDFFLIPFGEMILKRRARRWKMIFCFHFDFVCRLRRPPIHLHLVERRFKEKRNVFN